MIDVAYLRVYQPAASVSLPVAAGTSLARPRLTGATVTSETDVADAWEVEWEGSLWRCPRAPRRRMLESLVALHRSTSRFGKGMVDVDAAEAARRELRYLRTRESGPSPVMVSAWHPPLRWFIPFRPESTVEPMLLRTSMTGGAGRISDTVEAMRRAGLPDAWVEDLATVESWIRAFPPTSMLELDYRQVGWRHESADVESTVEDVSRAVNLMVEGDLAKSVEVYGAAMMRWAAAQSIGYSS